MANLLLISTTSDIPSTVANLSRTLSRHLPAHTYGPAKPEPHPAWGSTRPLQASSSHRRCECTRSISYRLSGSREGL